MCIRFTHNHLLDFFGAHAMHRNLAACTAMDIWHPSISCLLLPNGTNTSHTLLRSHEHYITDINITAARATVGSTYAASVLARCHMA
jgi:hypothetical protein